MKQSSHKGALVNIHTLSYQVMPPSPPPVGQPCNFKLRSFETIILSPAGGEWLTFMLRLNLKLTTVTGRRSTARLLLSFILLVLQVCSGRPGRTSCYAMRLNYVKIWPVTCVISLRDDGHHTWRHHKVRQLPGVTELAAWQLASFMMYAVRLHASRWSATKVKAALPGVGLTSCQVTTIVLNRITGF